MGAWTTAFGRWVTCALLAVSIGPTAGAAEGATQGVGAALPVTIDDVGTGFTAVYAVHTTAGIVLVDAHRVGREDGILRRLERHGLDPDDVTAIVVTHGHFDHAGSAAALAERLDVPVIAGAPDLPYLTGGVPAPFVSMNLAGKLIAATAPHGGAFPGFDVDVPVSDTVDLAPFGLPGGAVHLVGGHTPGSVTVELADGRAIVGDLVRTGLLRHHVPKRHFFQEDEAGALTALAGVLDRGATEVYAIHRGAMPAEVVRTWLATDAPVGEPGAGALSASRR